MAEQNNGSDEWRQVNDQVRDRAIENRRRSERLADQLSREAIQQAQRSVEGLLSIPTAFALGIASTTLYAAAIFERGFETVQITVDALRTGLEQGREQFANQADGPRLRDRAEARA